MNELTAKEARELVSIQHAARDAVRWRDLKDKLLDNIKVRAKAGYSYLTLANVEENVATKLKGWLVPLGYAVETGIGTFAKIKW